MIDITHAQYYLAAQDIEKRYALSSLLSLLSIINTRKLVE